MTIEIKLNKEVQDGKPVYRLLSMSGMLEKESLPSEYTNSEPCVWFNVPNKVIVMSPKSIYINHQKSIYINHQYPEQIIHEMIDHVKKAGLRLHDINQKIAKLKVEWTGEETYII